MTTQLREALNALNACQSADDVANLLRARGVVATPLKGKLWCQTCPIAEYLVKVGGVDREHVRVNRHYAYLRGEAPIQHQNSVHLFILGIDLRKDFPDLIAAPA